jgi:hypothetical protein
VSATEHPYAAFTPPRHRHRCGQHVRYVLTHARAVVKTHRRRHYRAATLFPLGRRRTLVACLRHSPRRCKHARERTLSDEGAEFIDRLIAWRVPTTTATDQNLSSERTDVRTASERVADAQKLSRDRRTHAHSERAFERWIFFIRICVRLPRNSFLLIS